MRLAQTRSPCLTFWPAVHVLVQRQQQQKRLNRRSLLTSQLASTSSLLRSRHREPRASRPFTSPWRSVADWQLWSTNQGQQRFFVSVFRWQFSAATPSAWRGHFGARTQRSLRWTIEQDLLLYNNNNIIATLVSELYRTMSSVGFVFTFSVLCYNNKIIIRIITVVVVWQHVLSSKRRSWHIWRPAYGCRCA